MNCKCGTELLQGAKFCIECGKKVPNPKQDVEKREAQLTIIHTDQKLAFSVKEAAVAIGVSQFLIREFINQGLLKHVRVGERRIIIRREALEEFLKEREI